MRQPGADAWIAIKAVSLTEQPAFEPADIAFEKEERGGGGGGGGVQGVAADSSFLAACL